MHEVDGQHRDHQGRDLFRRVDHFQLANQARAAGLNPFFVPVDCGPDGEAVVRGRPVIMAGSNNYLGLTHHPRVVGAAQRALETYGASLAGSRLLNGTCSLHEELEERVAAFLGVEDALVFSTGYAANMGVISALVDDGCLCVIDRAVHASVYDGGTMARGRTVRFLHNDVEHLEQTILRLPADAGQLVVVDGVYSMGGDIAPLPEIAATCRRYGVRLLVDDAHGIGTIGKGGRGTASHCGLAEGTDLVVGTFSKALASVGGFCAGPAGVVDYIRHFARSMLFTTSLPPASTAAALAALECLQEEPWRVERLHGAGAYVRSGLRTLGFAVGDSPTPIVSIRVGNELKAAIFWRDLLECGIYTNAVFLPAVPRGEAMIRMSFTATHTIEQLDQVLTAFGEVGRRHRLVD